MQKETQLSNVVVTLLETRDDGTIGLGNSEEMTIPDAIRAIENKEAKAIDAPIGVVPAVWKKGKSEAVGG